MAAGFQLAQINVARLIAPLESPEVAEFRDGIAAMNALAERQPGFVWRGIGTGFDAASDGDPMLVNVSVWRSVEDLAAFAYRTDHRHFVRRRHDWFEPATEACLALWWIAAGDFPTLRQAFDRLGHLRAHGPAAEAFDFRTRFAPPAHGPAREAGRTMIRARP